MAKKRQVHRKRVPMRRCIGCHESFPKRSLYRIVVSETGDLQVDPTGKQSGRGTYLCSSVQCWSRVLTPNDSAIIKALRLENTMPNKDHLRTFFKDQIQLQESEGSK
ncbi:MAG: YlxR family protein [Chloroflexota bacterium]